MALCNRSCFRLPKLLRALTAFACELQGSTAEADAHAGRLRLEAVSAGGARGRARLFIPDGSPGALDGVRLCLDVPWPLSIVVSQVFRGSCRQSCTLHVEAVIV